MFWLHLGSLQCYGFCSCFSSAINNKSKEMAAIKKLHRPFQSEIFAKRAYRELRLLKHMKHENVSITYTWRTFRLCFRSLPLVSSKSKISLELNAHNGLYKTTLMFIIEFELQVNIKDVALSLCTEQGACRLIFISLRLTHFLLFLEYLMLRSNPGDRTARRLYSRLQTGWLQRLVSLG